MIRIIPFLFLFLTFSYSTTACIDPKTIITTTVNYSDSFDQIEIRLGNLKLGSENPNSFCSCSISTYEDAFSILRYVAFVLPGTNDVYPNFDPWINDTDVDDAWAAAQPNFPNWSGFISEVVGQGLTTGEDVELIIRAELPPGYTITILDSVIIGSYLGTDKWDPVENRLVAAHQKVRNLVMDANKYRRSLKDDSYFENLDRNILTSTKELKPLDTDIHLFPNPVSDQIYLQWENLGVENLQLEIFDVGGNRLYKNNFDVRSNDQLRIPLDELSSVEKTGIYFIHLRTSKGILTKKVILQ